MIIRWLKLSMLIAMGAMLAAGCSAAVVTVTESNLNGWAWTSNKGISFLSNGGPCLDEGVGFAHGSGAYFGECGYNAGTGASTPTTHWLGTDTHAGQSLVGVPLSAIKKLTYSTYVTKKWTQKGGGGEEKYPSMPFQLQLTVQDSGGVRRQIWHRPWYDVNQWGARGSNYSDAHLGMWEDWDAIGGAYPGNQWYEAQTNWTGPWSSTDPLNPGVIEKWGSETLVATSTSLPLMGAGWDGSTEPAAKYTNGTATGTGMCLNFEVGARKGTTNIFGASYNWPIESIGFRGYVDNFTLGVDYNSSGTLEPSEEVTYDFETDKPAPRIVAVGGKGLYGEPGNPKHRFRFKVFGRVLGSIDGYVGATPIPDPTQTEFWVWDGSMKTDSTGAQIKACWQVICPDNGTDYWPGQYISVIGSAEARFYMKTDPSAFRTNKNDLTLLVDIGS